MDNNQQPVSPVPQLTPQDTVATASPPQPQATNPSESTSFPFWYYPNGVKTVFGAKSGTVTVSPGLIVVVDKATNQEIRHLAIGPDLKIKASFGTATIQFINGSKTSMWDKQYIFCFYNPKMYAISYWFMLMGRSKAKTFAAACRRAAGTNPS